MRLDVPIEHFGKFALFMLSNGKLSLVCLADKRSIVLQTNDEFTNCLVVGTPFKMALHSKHENADFYLGKVTIKGKLHKVYLAHHESRPAKP